MDSLVRQDVLLDAPGVRRTHSSVGTIICRQRLIVEYDDMELQDEMTDAKWLHLSARGKGNNDHTK